jgi:hypothetical protein
MCPRLVQPRSIFVLSQSQEEVEILHRPGRLPRRLAPGPVTLVEVSSTVKENLREPDPHLISSDNNTHDINDDTLKPQALGHDPAKMLLSMHEVICRCHAACLPLQAQARHN